MAWLPPRDQRAASVDGGTRAPYAMRTSGPLPTRQAPGARGNQDHDVTDRGRRGLRPASCRSSPDQPVALSQRLLARPGNDARNDRSGLAILPGEFADRFAAGLAAGA